jgi:hypothetical protein
MGAAANRGSNGNTSTLRAPRVSRRAVVSPHWDPDSRELWFQGVLLFRLLRSAVNLECILATFEEEGWPPRIYDPLPPDSATKPKHRLRDTIAKLNKRQQPGVVIRFYGDGTGEGIRWEVMSDATE